MFHCVTRNAGIFRAKHRTAEWLGLGMDLWLYLLQPLLQQGHLEQGAHMSRWLLEICKEETPHPLWATCTSAPSLAQHRTVFWHLEEPPILLSVPIASCPGTGHHWQEPDSILFAPSLQVLTGIYQDIDEILLTTLFSRLNSLSSLTLSSPVHKLLKTHFYSK